MNRKIFNLCDANRFFELPENKFLLKLRGKSFGTIDSMLELDSPCVIVSNHTSSLDKAFLSQIIASPFVFVRQEILEQIALKQMTVENFKQLLKCFNELKKANFSVVVFDNIGIAPFGEFNEISPEMSDFIMNFKLDIKFVNLYGSFFNFPVWATEKHKCPVKYISRKSLEFDYLKTKTSSEVNAEINSCLAFSASNQAHLFNFNIDSQKRAEFADRIVYSCPKCKSLFSIYSEFSCLKCKNCGSAIEFSKSGTITLSKDVRNLDQLKENLYDSLKKHDFSTKPLQTYEDCLILKKLDENKSKFEKIKLTIYAHKLVLEELANGNEVQEKQETTISIKNLQKIAYIDQNTVKIWQKNKNPIVLKGKGRENFYIIFDLIKVNNGETK